MPSASAGMASVREEKRKTQEGREGSTTTYSLCFKYPARLTQSVELVYSVSQISSQSFGLVLLSSSANPNPKMHSQFQFQ
jgi:hypothetical protein